MEKVKETSLNGYEHQVYPFDKLVEELDLQRDMSRSAIFDIMVVLQNAGDKSKEHVGGIDYNSEHTISKFDLTFGFQEAGEIIVGSIEYNTDIYSGEQVSRLAVHYESLLRSLLEDSSLPLKQVSYLARSEREMLLEAFNSTDSLYPCDKTIQELFEQQVAQTPDAVAISWEGKNISYRELNEKSNLLAHYLREDYSIARDEVVGLMLDRSSEMVIGILGILKAGGAYLPIDPSYPSDRKKYMLEDSGMRVLLSDESKLEESLSSQVHMLDMAPILSGVKGSERKRLKNPVLVNSSKDLAYVIYTSGSTGSPKGVMVEQRSY